MNFHENGELMIFINISPPVETAQDNSYGDGEPQRMEGSAPEKELLRFMNMMKFGANIKRMVDEDKRDWSRPFQDFSWLCEDKQ